MTSNFDFLSPYWPRLAKLGAAAEAALHIDPRTCGERLIAFSSEICGAIFAVENIVPPEDAGLAARLHALRVKKLLPQNADAILSALQRFAHRQELSTDIAELHLRLAHALAGWLMQACGDQNYIAAEFVVHEIDDPAAALGLLDAELAAISAESAEAPACSPDAEERHRRAMEAASKLTFTEREQLLLQGSQLRIRLAAVQVVNYALQQNRVPMLQSLKISNNSDRALENVELRFSASPEFCTPLTRQIDYVAPRSSLDLSGVHLGLNAEFLAGLTEKVSGQLCAALYAGEELLCEERVEITALAFDEWHGYGFYPELLAAFVTPNHPEIARLIARAAELLEKWTGDPSLDAYQSNDVNRVLAQAAAVYGVLQEQNIVYAVPPASFERAGQRVRLCDAVLAQRLGCCLDLSLLYAACLEAIGLHPLLIIKRGHIFAGLWLDELAFPDPVQDDPSLVTKRMAEGVSEIALVECTLVTAGKRAAFDEARAEAEREIAETEAVECIIDVNRARLSGVSPLPLRIQTENGWRIDRSRLDETDLTLAPQDMSNPIKIEDVKPESAFPKMVQWERKLLDLGLRNALINLRLSKTMIPILTSSLDELENALSDGSDFSIAPRPADWHAAESAISFENMHDLAGQDEIIKTDFKNNRLRSVLNETDLNRTVKDLYRSAKAALEENGANTLYLALGLLKWYETDRSAKARYAPIVLLPIEMVRKGAHQGYVIRLRDEEPQMNITILEKLKQDFKIVINGLDPLPADAHGIDTRKVFTILRKAIMGQPRWDVLESAYLGTFSFSQFVMWNDIRNRADDLMQSKLVRSLIDGQLAWAAEDMRIGDRVDEGGVLLPIPADASQLFAIQSACEGQTFVLHGPPGTGKSQTITALIANALAQGKTVLFVAEKMAALEVVQKRLSSIGIGAFCLELHSNKSKKRDLLEQLRQAAEVTRTQTPEDYARRAEKIATLRHELDLYAVALHKKQPCGMTVYALINGYEAHRHAEDIAPFPPALLREITPEQLDAQHRLVDRLIAAARGVGHPCGHPLHLVRCPQYSQSLKAALPGAIAAYRGALNTLRRTADVFAADIGQPAPGDLAAFESLRDISAELTFWLSMPSGWTRLKQPAPYFDEIRRMARHYIRAAELRQQLSGLWQDSFFDLSGAQLLSEHKANEAKWFLPKLIGGRRFAKRMAVHAKSPMSEEDMVQHITDLMTCQREKLSGDKLFAVYGSTLNGLCDGSETDWRRILAAIDQADERLRLPVSPVVERIRVELGGNPALSGNIIAMSDAWRGMSEAQQRLYDLLSVAPSDAEDWIAQQLQLCSDILSNTDILKEWFTWNAVAAEAVEHGLQPVVDAYRAGLSHSEVSDAYRKSVYGSLAAQAIEQDLTLNMFSGVLFNERIEQFRKLDHELTELAKEEIFCRLAAKVPNFAKEAAQSSELGILQRAIRSGGRGTSIRRLFEQIPNLLPRLCPCMLMSPISAAQYLDPNREPFDIVVFDEASQLPTCKAVGVLARGNDAVIVGDPKQMPPTTFFDSNRADEENLEAEDLESILDDCLALSMPQTHLLWHYRSRHESLIAFSNRQFYENKLYTFPSVNDRERKVRLVPVDGQFDRGRTRTNRAEADAIVEELKRRCHDPELQRLSVGVVTFNISQQHLIDDLLLEACKADAELEAWAYNSAEPVFIKNLENVQGDERDAILFSVSYGPDSTGKVSMNFGPLNRTGGWRRLNVAVTRAHHEMMVFSTLRPEQISLTRSSAVGVAALKRFLEYAAGDELPESEQSARQRTPDLDGVANAICAALAEHGYPTQQHVGHSEYRIDVGVVDPDDPSKYLLGILLDGDSYGAAKTTRDREIAQISVLNGLGWKILRVWTMDWWDNSKKETARILAALHGEEPKKPGPRGPGDFKAFEPLLTVDGHDPEDDAFSADELSALPAEETASAESPASAEAAPAAEPVPQPPVLPEEILPEAPAEPEPPVQLEVQLQSNSSAGIRLARAAVPAASDVPVYAATELPLQDVSPEDFLLPRYNSSIMKRVDKVLLQEAPISEGLLTRRIIQSYGISRTGARIQARMNAIYSSMKLKSTLQGGERFFWDPLQSPRDYTLFRASGEDVNRREVKDVPIQEAANAVCRVLEEQVSLAQEDLIREAARMMGYTRAGAAASALFAAAIQFSAKAGRIAVGANGNWILSQIK